VANKESTVRTLTVAVLVCLVCSVFVAGAAVALKPAQVENRQLDKQRSILAIAGLGEAGMSAREVKALFAERIQARVVDLDKGAFSDAQDPASFDPLKAAKDPKLSLALSGEQDIASIKRRENFTTVYLVEKDGALDTLILPVRGYGLWSTLYGFIAVALYRCAIDGVFNPEQHRLDHRHGDDPGKCQRKEQQEVFTQQRECSAIRQHHVHSNASGFISRAM
jgi:Na+-transporting NADH:ubiquinone oxidoreductase subunit C